MSTLLEEPVALSDLTTESLEKYQREVDRLFELVEARAPFARNRDRLMFGLMIYAGLRRIECTRIQWSDVNLKQRVLAVRNGKGAKPRLIAINDRLHDILSSAARYGDHVLTIRGGRSLTRATLTKVAERYLNRLEHEYQGRKRSSWNCAGCWNHC